MLGMESTMVTTTDATPEPTEPATETVAPVADTSAATAALPETTPAVKRRRLVLGGIIGGSVLAAALIFAGGIAVGANLPGNGGGRPSQGQFGNGGPQGGMGGGPQGGTGSDRPTAPNGAPGTGTDSGTGTDTGTDAGTGTDTTEG